MDALGPPRLPVPARMLRPVCDETRGFRFSVREILISLIFLFIVRPFVETTWGRLTEAVLYSLVLLSTLVAVGARRRELLLGFVLILPALTFRWLSHLLSLSQNDPLPLICLTLAFSFTIWQLLRFVMHARQVNLDVLCAGISVYLLLGQVWGYFYLLVDRFVPGSFLFPGLSSHPTSLRPDVAFYFSMCTITTASYGDIIPASPQARTLATLESTTGVLYVAVLLAQLVAMRKAGHAQSQRSDGDSIRAA